jgi:hypothetical protein
MGNNQCSEVCFNLPSSCFELYLLLRLISGCEQPCKNSRIIIRDLDNFYFLSYDSRVGAPEWKNGNMQYILSSCPKEPDLWPHVLGSESHNSKVHVTMVFLRIEPS